MSRFRILALLRGPGRAGDRLRRLRQQRRQAADEDPQAVLEDATFEGDRKRRPRRHARRRRQRQRRRQRRRQPLRPVPEPGPRANCPELDLTADVERHGQRRRRRLRRRPDAALRTRPSSATKATSTKSTRPPSASSSRLRTGQQERRSNRPKPAPPARKPPAGLKVGDFVDNLTNEGSADVGGTDDDQGQRRPQRRRGDRRDHQAHRRPGLQRPARKRRAAAARQLEEAKGEVEKALKNAHVDVYVGDDNIVRKARRRTDDRTEGQRAKRSKSNFDLALNGVNEEQEISAPSGAKPLERPVPEARDQPDRTARRRPERRRLDLGGLLDEADRGAAGDPAAAAECASGGHRRT